MHTFIILFLLYLIILIGNTLGIRNSEYIYPKGLWKLVPFRVSGWKDSYTGKRYKLKWIFDSNNKYGEIKPEPKFELKDYLEENK